MPDKVAAKRKTQTQADAPAPNAAIAANQFIPPYCSHGTLDIVASSYLKTGLTWPGRTRPPRSHLASLPTCPRRGAQPGSHSTYVRRPTV
jgi:hypothetical protein